LVRSNEREFYSKRLCDMDCSNVGVLVLVLVLVFYFIRSLIFLSFDLLVWPWSHLNRVFEKPSRISIAFSDYFLVYSKNVFNVKVCCPPDQNPFNK
jgi:hypothetical protein